MKFSSVIKQCLLPSETFVTLSTLEGSFSSVYPLMVLQVREAFQTFFTTSTFEGPLIVMYHLGKGEGLNVNGVRLVLKLTG